MTDTVKEGSTVKVHYTGTFDDGKIFDTSQGRAPIEFTVGKGQVIKGFEDAVLEMRKGEEKNISLQPDQAYGPRNEKLVLEVPKEVLKIPEPKIGMVLSMKAEDGREFRAIITKVIDNKVTIDLNHPLAGKKLNFKLKIEDIR
ncbi:peptidylprolyl isomerase [Candidatus Woesearchaeota archaeon]|nr:MAG: peptidylprolyl isomerase [Candidatus Woesearchaeota archaeon]